MYGISEYTCISEQAEPYDVTRYWLEMDVTKQLHVSKEISGDDDLFFLVVFFGTT